MSEPMVVYGKKQLIAAVLAVGPEEEIIEVRRASDDSLVTRYRLREQWFLSKKTVRCNLDTIARNIRRIPEKVFS